MSKYVFLFKENYTDDRDCVRYVEIDDLRKHHVCIDGRFKVQGACYSASLKPEVAYGDITTCLTEEQYNRLCNPQADDDFSDIVEALLSVKNQLIFEDVQAEEKEWLLNEYGLLNDDDIEEIWSDYGLDYRDRGIVGIVYADRKELGESEADNYFDCYGVDDNFKRYFDYEKFADDLVEEEQYYECSSGTIVYLNY